MRLLVCLILLSYNYCSVAQTYEEYINLKKYAKALQLVNKEYSNALAKKNNIYSNNVAEALTKIAYCQQQLKQYDDAILAMTQAQAINQFLYSDSSGIAGYDHHLLGILYYEKGNFLDAACSFEREFLIHRRIRGVLSKECADDMFQAAICYDKANILKEAERSYTISLELYKNLDGNHETAIRSIHQSLIQFYRNTKRIDLADSLAHLNNLSTYPKTNDLKAGETCDCIQHLLPEAELKKLGLSIR